ncbi:MAG: hypothetical protein IJS94_02275 [Clostridia bacterium]|nr:hypothetical protein [Clostridia bacterium]
MIFRKRKIKYEITVPPIDKPFEQFTKEEAKEYFDWYISHIEERIDCLKKFSGVDLDYSMDSLVTIWSWFINNTKLRSTSEIKLLLIRIKLMLMLESNYIIETVLRERSWYFSLETEYIIKDIAVYFGEVCIKNNRSLYWGYYTDTEIDSFANMPVLMGFEDKSCDPPFKASFELNSEVHGVACSLCDGTATEEALINAYKKWQYMIHG